MIAWFCYCYLAFIPFDDRGCRTTPPIGCLKTFLIKGPSFFHSDHSFIVSEVSLTLTWSKLNIDSWRMWGHVLLLVSFLNKGKVLALRSLYLFWLGLFDSRLALLNCLILYLENGACEHKNNCHMAYFLCIPYSISWCMYLVFWPAVPM